MKKLIELAKKIENLELREKVINFLKDPKLSHKDFEKYPREEIEKAGAVFTVSSPHGSVIAKRDVLNHTTALVELCEKTAEVVEKNYKIPINKDNLIAAAILHDIMKMFEWKREGEELEHSGILLDHTILGVAELYHRGFPEEVLHLIASHAGEAGTTPPRNYEALILHYIDTLLSLTEFHLYGVKQEKQPVQLLVLDEETMKKIREESEKKD